MWQNTPEWLLPPIDKLRTLFALQILQIYFGHVSYLQKQPSQRCSMQKDVLRNFTKFTGKHLCLRPATLFKKGLWHRCFPVNFVKFLTSITLNYHSNLSHHISKIWNFAKFPFPIRFKIQVDSFLTTFTVLENWMKSMAKTGIYIAFYLLSKNSNN